jgi:hypothetical protein
MRKTNRKVKVIATPGKTCGFYGAMRLEALGN